LKRPNGLADNAVHREPVSAPNSLLTGKNTGKFAKLGPWGSGFRHDVPTLGHFCRVVARVRTGNLWERNRESRFNIREIFGPSPSLFLTLLKESGHAENRP
jgi:hypothetical protein